MKFLIEIAYDGSKFYGFQKLNDYNTVQKCLEEALSKINKSSVTIKGAGRTDRGVHANGQCVSFKLDINISSNGLQRALNSLIEPYIYVKSVKIVDTDFHARFNVKEKIYVYKINLGEYNPIMSDYIFQCKYKLDVEKMIETSKYLLGVHNFRNFVSGYRNNYECIIYSIDFKKESNVLNIVFKGKSFYRYMVRNMVGALIDVGRGKIDSLYVKEMLDNCEQKQAFTAPACGLYLENIKYE